MKTLPIILIVVSLFIPDFSFATNDDNASDRIDKVAANLKGLNLGCPNSIKKVVEAGHIHFLKRKDATVGLYSEVKQVANGRDSTIYRATLAEDRPRSGLKKGDIIALRQTTGKRSPESIETKGSTLQGLVWLSTLKDLKKWPKPLTAYYPDFYGVYYSSTSPMSTVPWSNYIQIEEMEWVDTTFLAQYIPIGKPLSDKQNMKEKMPDSVIFEYLYGEWVAQFFLNLNVCDRAYRNFGLKKVDYARCYHLGEKIYYFTTGLMPMRLDLVVSTRLVEQSFMDTTINPQIAETSEGEAVLQCQREADVDIFSLFETFFSKYLREETWIQENEPKAQHFYLEQQHIDHERSLAEQERLRRVMTRETFLSMSDK